MNYENQIQQIITTMKSDTTLNPKWRNYIVKELEVASAMCSKLSSREISKNEMQSLVDKGPVQPNQINGSGCVCREGLPYDTACPVHGL